MAAVTDNSPARIGILGGTFNPVHIGHLRVSLVMAELLGTSSFVLMPTALPPHKRGKAILPFDLRCELLEAVAAELPPLCVSRLEGRRSSPSYTWDTLCFFKDAHPNSDLFFVLGCEDFAKLGSWRSGLRLPERAHLCIVPRGGCDAAAFLKSVYAFWPEARAVEPIPGAQHTIDTGNGQVSFFDVPLLQVSSTRLRERWIQGRDLRLLIPKPALDILTERWQEISAIWKGEE